LNYTRMVQPAVSCTTDAGAFCGVINLGSIFVRLPVSLAQRNIILRLTVSVFLQGLR